MNLVVDYGNSSAKIGIFENDALVEKRSFTEPESLKNYLSSVKADHLIVSSVSIDANLIAAMAPDVPHKLILTYALSLPITILYQTPETLGVDRIAAVCGAHELFPGKDCLVIDAGTCITYDFIDSAARYHGGAISPGISIRFRSLSAFTSRLPLVTEMGNLKLTGSSTKESIQAGVGTGTISEIEGFISKYQANHPNLITILCGGDIEFFENNLKPSIFACPDLVLNGLNGVIKHNIS